MATDYEINNVGEFLDIKNDLSGNYTLNVDLDLTSASFSPFGTSSTMSFTGTFEGNNHTISNLTYSNSTRQYAGLFGYAKNATFKNVTLENFYVMGEQDVGALVGCAVNSTIENVRVFNSSVTVPDKTTDHGRAGGIVGCLDEGSGNTSNMTHCSADNVSVLAHVDGGGLIGSIGTFGKNYTKTTTVSQCYFNGTVTVSHHAAGGLVGSNFGGHIEDCYALDSVICDGTSTATGIGHGLAAGGIIGNMFAGSIKNCFFSGVLDINTNTSSYPRDSLGCIGVIQPYTSAATHQLFIDMLDTCPINLVGGTNISDLNSSAPPLKNSGGPALLNPVTISPFENIGWDIKDVDNYTNGIWVFDNGSVRFNWSYPPLGSGFGNEESESSSSGGSRTGSAHVVNPTSGVSGVSNQGGSAPVEPLESFELPGPIHWPADAEPPALRNFGFIWWLLALIVGFIIFAGIAYNYWKKNSDEYD